MRPRPFETRSFAYFLAVYRRDFALITRKARACASCLAALPSTRAIETRLLPSPLAATHRGFAFYVGFPKRSIPSIATCSMSLIPSAPFTDHKSIRNRNSGKL